MSGAAAGPPPPSAQQVRAFVCKLRRKYRDAPILGVRTTGDWPGGAEIDVDGAPLSVLHTDSPLEVRERLARAGGEPLVLLTRLDESELGADVVACLARQRLFSVDVWQLVLDRFRARRVDPRLTSERWIAEALLDAVASGAAPALPSGLLAWETAWSVLLGRTLGLEGGASDLSGVAFDLRDLVEWAADPASVERLRACRPELRAGLRKLADGQAGPAAGLVLGCLEGTHAERVVPVGLVCRTIFAADENPAAANPVAVVPTTPPAPGAAAGGAVAADADGAASAAAIAAAAAVRLEPLVGGRTVSPEAGRAWADAAEATVDALVAAGQAARARSLVEDADRLLGELKAEDLARGSRFLSRSLVQRLGDFGRRLDAVLASPAGADLDGLARAARAVRKHRDARDGDPRSRAADMATRLARWLARKPARSVGAGARAEPGTLAETARDFAGDGGFVDLARAAIRVAAVEPSFTRALSALDAELGVRREHDNQRFAQLLAACHAAPEASPSLLPIERVLDDVVAPLAKLRAILVVVFDGLGYPVFRELLASVCSLGWVELAPSAHKALPAVLSVVPSVTSFARASLLSGRLCQGSADLEKKGFAEHPALAAASSAKRPPLLFHKSEILALSGAGLAAHLVDAIAEPARRVVGVVVNAVDDRLATGDQVEARWTVDDVRALRGLLEMARDAGRLVVFASDHGHVVEAGSESREGAEGERWRSPARPPQEGEIRIEGPRVLPPLGGAVVVPWSERIRYGARRAGYHGGATPQEMVVPLAVLAAGAVELEGWVEVPSTAPEWWLGEDDRECAASQAVQPLHAERPASTARQRRPRPTADRQPDLFGGAGRDVAVERGAAPAAGQGAPATRAAASGAAPGAAAERTAAAGAVLAWIDTLLACEAWAQQMRFVSRQAIASERVRAVLAFLAERGGKATRTGIARHLELPEIRVTGLVAALRRALNVDGYDVLALDEASDTVVLNVELLRVQFGV